MEGRPGMIQDKAGKGACVHPAVPYIKGDASAGLWSHGDRGSNPSPINTCCVMPRKPLHLSGRLPARRPTPKPQRHHEAWHRSTHPPACFNRSFPPPTLTPSCQNPPLRSEPQKEESARLQDNALLLTRLAGSEGKNKPSAAPPPLHPFFVSWLPRKQRVPSGFLPGSPLPPKVPQRLPNSVRGKGAISWRRPAHLRQGTVTWLLLWPPLTPPPSDTRRLGHTPIQECARCPKITRWGWRQSPPPGLSLLPPPNPGPQTRGAGVERRDPALTEHPETPAWNKLSFHDAMPTTRQ